jgi:hypothetical protein
MNHQRAVLGEQALTSAHRMLDKRRRLQIPENFGASCDTLRFKAAVRDPVSHVEKYPLSQSSNGGGRVGLPPDTYAVPL